MLGKTKRFARTAAASARRPPWVAPGHYYSPIPNGADTLRALRWRAASLEDGRPGGRDPDLDPEDRFGGVDLRADRQREVLKQLSPYFGDVPTTRTDGWRYEPDNSMYGLADAAVYHAMLRQHTPRRVVEVGSGFSSAIALDTADRYLRNEVSFTFIEPYPQRLLSLLSREDRERCELLRRPVQDAGFEPYEQLEAGDFLFIDSTHVAKAGSDVNFLFFQVLPRLADGVLVHIHDVLWPFEYSERWLREGRGWTEAYLLQAFLAYNSVFTIELFNGWIWHNEPRLISELLPAAADQLPGGIWLSKRGQPTG